MNSERFSREGWAWTSDDDAVLLLSYARPDRITAMVLRRSIKAIRWRRSRLLMGHQKTRRKCGRLKGSNLAMVEETKQLCWRMVFGKGDPGQLIG